MTTDKEEIIREAVEELIGKGNTGIIGKTFSKDYIAHAGEKEYSGHAFIKQFSNQIHTSIPDIRIVDITFLTDDVEKITWQRTLQGTHEVQMQGIPASRKKVKWTEMIVSRFERKKIAEEWIVSELMGQLLVKVSDKK